MGPKNRTGQSEEESSHQIAPAAIRRHCAHIDTPRHTSRKQMKDKEPNQEKVKLARRAVMRTIMQEARQIAADAENDPIGKEAEIINNEQALEELKRAQLNLLQKQEALLYSR